MKTNPTPHPKLSLESRLQIVGTMASIVAIGVAIWAVLSTTNESRVHIEQNSHQFRRLFERDSLLNIKEDALLDRQLALAELQNQIMFRQFQIDSITSEKEIRLANNNLELKIKEQEQEYNADIQELLAIIMNIKFRDKGKNLNPADPIERLMLEAKIEQVVQDLNSATANYVLLNNSDLANKWHDAIKRAQLSQTLIHKRGSKGFSLLNNEKQYSDAVNLFLSSSYAILTDVEKKVVKLRIDSL